MPALLVLLAPTQTKAFHAMVEARGNKAGQKAVAENKARAEREARLQVQFEAQKEAEYKVGAGRPRMLLMHLHVLRLRLGALCDGHRQCSVRCQGGVPPLVQQQTNVLGPWF
jgi:hypothetical protein